MTTARDGLVLAGVEVRFGSSAGLKDIDVRVEQGTRAALLGPSGVGKTTLLRAIAGLSPVSAGTVQVNGRDVTHEAPEARGVVYMHQTASLFPHLSVIDNVAFPLEVRGVPRGEARRRALPILSRVRLDGLALRRPDTLSGGQRHRVALARALAAQPAVLLLDEPFSSLDPSLRVDVRQALVDVLGDRSGPAVVLVTHDVDEAAELADRLIVLLQDGIAQADTPERVLRAPASPEVARFVGIDNVVSGHRDARGFVHCALGTLDSPGRPGPVTVTARASDVRVGRQGPESAGVVGTVVAVHARVAGTTARVRVADETVFGVPMPDTDLAAGQAVSLSLDARAPHVLDR